MRIIFVYAGSPDDDRRHSPYSITRNMMSALRQTGHEVIYYDWAYTGPVVDLNDDDIVLAHPNYPDDTACRKLFNQDKGKRYLIFPFHHGMPNVNLPFDDLHKKCIKHFAICGQYWYDTIDSSRFSHWKEKMVRLDMAIDQSQYPKVKNSFQMKGFRKFGYIGSDIPEKNLDFMARMFDGQPYKLEIFGNVHGESFIARLPNVTLNGWVDTSPQWAEAIASRIDCFLSTSISDANPTTLLEAGSWGFHVACSPQSGYWPDERSNGLFHGLNLSDLHGCKLFLQWMNDVKEDILIKQSDQTRRRIGFHHTWSKFTNKVLSEIGLV